MKLAILFAIIAAFVMVASTYAMSMAQYNRIKYQDLVDSLLEEEEEEELEELYTEQSCAQNAVARARSHVGDAYVFGATGPHKWDCSGLVQNAFAGCVSLPRTAGDQCSRGHAVPRSQARAGDIACYPGHVAIVSGPNSIIHAANPGRGVVTDSLYGSPTIRRLV